MIENTTPYVGTIKLKFESSPYYSTHNNKLNKVHLNLGFTKLVSRITLKDTLDGHVLDEKKVELINNNTGGVIGDYEWEDNAGTHTLLKSFIAYCQDKKVLLEKTGNVQNKKYIGDVDKGWWYYKNKFVVTHKRPNGVARKVDSKGNTIGYYGYTHRGGCLFKIGNKIFDENWQANELHKDFKKYKKRLSKSHYSDSITYVMPFTERGEKTIENYYECEQAAINLSKYLG